MADFSMTYSALTDAATKVNTAKSDLDTVISALDSAVNALSGNWSGQAYEAFVNAWTESKPTMQKLAEAVEAYAPELNKAVEDQTSLDQGKAGTMSGLAF